MKRWRCEVKARDDWERGDLFECYATAEIEAEAREAIAAIRRRHVERQERRKATR